ncbi:Cysteine synthase 2 [Smittium mucronatum]|uniref:Cysteine synthase 2 n=1 Tax=Smittium mucronatum TaxID=133383 RepID=A0A1R0H4A0_9FUNG|nr:Cysteine synthase 2 [Smittium mucronatum]
MPNDVASEKRQILEKMGATVELVKPCSIVDPNNFVRVAERRAQEYELFEGEAKDGSGESITRKGFFMDQFENPSNFAAHYKNTGPEIFKQMKGKPKLDAIVHGSGTGGTISGLSLYLKPRIPGLKMYLADPPGSGLANKVNHNVMFSETEREGTRRRHQVDTIIEGVGLNRLTSNFSLLFQNSSFDISSSSKTELEYEQDQAGNDLGLDEQDFKYIDGAFSVSDQQAVHMARFVMDNDGLFLGSSSALNLVAVVQLARKLGKGCTILTILCDSGQRHLTKFWNDEWLAQSGLDTSTPSDLSFF